MELSDFSFCQGDDRHAGELQMLEQGGDVGLIAAYPVQRLGEHQVKLALLRILQQHLDAGPQHHARSGYARILIATDDLPAFTLCLLATDAELILDRGVPLAFR